MNSIVDIAQSADARGSPRSSLLGGIRDIAIMHGHALVGPGSGGTCRFTGDNTLCACRR